MPRALAAAANAKVKGQNWQWACEEQEQFFYYQPKPILASGGFNSAKTMGAIFKLLWLADAYPGYRIAVARRFSSELKQTTLQTFFKLCPPQAYAKGNKNESAGVVTVTLNNGSRFIFLHLDRPDAVSIIRGLEINAALLDQAEEMQEEVYDLLESRLSRWDKVTVPKEMVDRYKREVGGEWPFQTEDHRLMPPAFMLLTCNPDLQDHWLYRRFHPESHEWQEKWKDEGYLMLTFDTLKNRFASKENVRILTSKDKVFQDRFVHGIWGSSEGVIFHVDQSSILEPTPDLLGMIRTHCRLYRILDHGDSGITCCLWMAVDHEGNVFFYREWYGSGNVRYIRSVIFELSKADYVKNTPPQYVGNYADPVIAHKVARRVGGRDVVNRWSVADEYSDTKQYPRETAIHWALADNDEMSSRERVQEYLRIDDLRMHPIRRERGAPKLYFLKRTETHPHGCLHAIHETRAARRIQIGSENGRPIYGEERDETIPDHALDCVRYGILSRPTAAQPKTRSYGRLTWQGYSELMREHRRRQTSLRNTYR